MKASVIFLVKSQKTPSSRIRIHDLLPFLSDLGIRTEMEFIPKSFLKRHRLFKKCAAFDMVVLQKRLLAWFEFCELRKNAAVLGFDFDDAVYMKNKSPSTNLSDYKSRTRHRRFRRIVKTADLLFAANPILAEYSSKLTPHSKINIIPSSVNISNLKPKTNFKLSSPAVIGWVGTKVTQRYLDFIAPQLCELRKKHDFVLRIISDMDYQYDGLAVENIRWTPEGENCEISKFDIGIMPLSSDPYSEGKSSYKLLQYLSAGIPSVASAVGMNNNVADNSNSALLADNAEEFRDHLDTLLQDCDMRKKLGTNGRQLIEKEYSQEVVGAKFAKIIAEHCGLK